MGDGNNQDLLFVPQKATDMQFATIYLTAGKSYTMIVYARTADGKVAAFSVSKLVTIN